MKPFESLAISPPVETQANEVSAAYARTKLLRPMTSATTIPSVAVVVLVQEIARWPDHINKIRNGRQRLYCPSVAA